MKKVCYFIISKAFLLAAMLTNQILPVRKKLVETFLLIHVPSMRARLWLYFLCNSNLPLSGLFKSSVFCFRHSRRTIVLLSHCTVVQSVICTLDYEKKSALCVFYKSAPYIIFLHGVIEFLLPSLITEFLKGDISNVNKKEQNDYRTLLNF